MKTILLLASLLLSSAAFAHTTVEIKVKPVVSGDVRVQRTVDRYSYNFGQVRLYTSQYVTYTLTNTGTTPMTFSQALIGGAGFDAYHNCTGAIQPNEKCSFEIIFQPMSEFASSGRFILSFVEDLDIVVDVFGIGSRY